MRTPNILILAATAAVAILAQTADVEAGSHKHRRFHSSGGEHYDTVMANYIRRCTDLSNQFERARADRAASPQLAQASALYDRGVSHCAGGARLQGIDELTAALRQLGAIPRVTL
jgi:hypothetical protein